MGKLVAIFFGSLLLFLIALPGNHSEAEDAFEYARLVEEGQGAVQFHPHHLLYIPLQKGIFESAQVLGYQGRSYPVSRAVSIIAGAIALCLFYCIARDLKCHFPMATTLGLLFSYGFIRYTCEVEIYILAMALALAAIRCALRKRAVAGIVFSSLAVLMHIVNFSAVFVVIPLIHLLLFRNWKRAVLSGSLTAVMVGTVYLFVSKVWGTYCPPVDTSAESWFQAGTLFKAIAGFGQCVLSANFAFGFDAVADKLHAAFPYRVFAEEIFAAKHIPTWIRIIAPFTFFSALATLFITGIIRIRHLKIKESITWVLFVWLIGTMLPTLVIEPSNPELWILTLPAFWLFFFCLGPDKFPRWLIVVMMSLLGLHNLLAGMGAVKTQRGDYNFQKAKWVLAHAGKDDVIHTAESFVFTFYLDYWSEAEVRNINTQDWKAGGKTFVFDDVFNPPPAVGIRYPVYEKKVKSTAEILRPICKKMNSDEFGGIWIVENAPLY